MSIEIKPLKKQDHKNAIRFAITGMHFDWYLSNKFLLNLYGKYFWYLELTRATQIFAAYDGERLAGVLLAEIKGEAPQFRSVGKKLYVKIFDILQNLLYKNGAGLYEKTTAEMLEEYKKSYSPDGEIIFLAADPDSKVKGVGSLLLSAFENAEAGKEIFLFTDDGCTYQFYDHRGFSRACERDIELDFGKKKVPLKCFVFSKRTNKSNIST